MKKIYFLIILMFGAFCACDLLNGTQDQTQNPDPSGPSITNPDDIVVGDKETLAPDAQKEKLEQVAEKMIDLFPSNEYEDIMEMCAEAISYGANIFDEDYDFSELEEVWEDIGESFFRQENISEYETRYFLYLFLSNCTGIVEFGKNKATYQESSQTKVIFNSRNGEKWEAEITPKGLKQVYLGEWMDSYYDYYYDWETDHYEEYWYTEYYDVTVEIPSSLTASLKRNGSTIAEVSFSIDHNIGKNGIDLETGSISFSCEVILDDLRYNASTVKYDAKSGNAEFNSSLYKGDIFVFSESFSGNASYDLDEDGYVEDWDGKGLSFKFNLLGEIQMLGSCTDIKKMSELGESDINSENSLERIVNNMNSLMDIGVYYDGTSTKQASIKLEPMVEEDPYYGNSYWIEPVIVFEDGSRYLFYEYFQEEDFKYLIKKFERMLESYENMFEDFEDIIDQ